MRQATLAELRATLESAMQTPSQAAAMADLVPDMVRALPPERSELASRPEFHLGTDTVLQAVFENVRPSTGEAQDSPQVIEIPYGIWIRGVAAYAVSELPGGTDQIDLEELPGIIAFRNGLGSQLGDCGRYKFDVNWRLDGKQGFVQRGAGGEILANATGVTGTGKYPADMDWMLEKDQTIEVRIRNVFDRLVGRLDLTSDLRLVVVAFYGLRMPLRPSNPRTQFGR